MKKVSFLALVAPILLCQFCNQNYWCPIKLNKGYKVRFDC
jgi:hypothetical protein